MASKHLYIFGIFPEAIVYDRVSIPWMYYFKISLCKENTGHFSIAEFAFGKIISNEKYYFNTYSSFSISRRSIKKLL